MPCNFSGFYDPVFLAQFGVVDFDWSNAKQIWANMKPMDAETLLVQQAAMVKAVNNDTRIWVYRNLVKALPWYSSVQAKINDPAYSGWFLHFKPTGPYNVPQCDTNWNPPRCSDLYHDQDQTPQHPHGDGSCTDACDCGGVPCGEYLWDLRNASLRDWLVTEHIFVNGLSNANISGFYFDDGWTNTSAAVLPWEPQPLGYCDHSPIGGATEEDYNCTQDMGLVQQDTTDITNAYLETMSAVHDAVVNAGGWAWQYLSGVATPPQGDLQACTAFFRRECNASTAKLYGAALQYDLTWNKTTGVLPQLSQDLASFLLVRGDYGWLGYGWLGCTSDSVPGAGGPAPYAFPPELKADYGIPTERCSETNPGVSGVFSRQWSKASVSFDCNAWTGTVTPSEG